MNKNKFFRFPYGYIEEKGFESKKSQLKDLLEDNVEVDGMQTKKIESNTAAINAEVERSSTLDEKIGKDLEEEISERKRMGSILNDKLAKLENDVKDLVGNTSDAFDSVADSLKAADEKFKAKDSELEKSLEEEVKRAKTAEENLQKTTDELSVRLGKEINTMVESNFLLQESLNTEKTSRETRDSELNAKINVEMAERIAAIETERLRAETKENEIAASLDSRISTVNSNMTSLVNSLSKVNTMVDDEIKRAKSEEANLRTVIDSESEKNAKFQELISNELTYAISELKTKDLDLENKINEEVIRANKKEESIVSKIDNVEISLTNRLNINSDATSVIESRVTSTENKLNNIFLTNTNELEYVLYVGGAPKGTINIPKDNFLKNVELVNDDLIFTFIADGVEKILPVNISQYVDVYTAGDGLSVHNYKFNLKLDRSGEVYLKVTSDGLKLEGVNSAIESAINDYSSNVDTIIASIESSIVNEGTLRAKGDEYLELLINDESIAARNAEDKLNTKLLNLEPIVLDCENKFNILNNENKNIKLQLTSLGETIEEVRSEIPSLEGYASELYVDNAVADKVTEAKLAETIEDVNEKVNGLIEEVRSEIPSLEGYATEAKLVETIEDVNEKVNGLIEEVRSEIPSLEGYATEAKLTETIEEVRSEIPSLEGYATEAKLVETIKEVRLEIPSLEGYATEAKLTEEIEEVRSEIPSLEGYATEAKLTETIEEVRSEIPSLEGYASELYVVNAVADKVTETKLSEEISNVQSKVNSIINKEFEMLKELVINLQLKVNELEGRMYSSQEIIDKVKSMKEGDVLNLKLFNNITINSVDRLTIPQNSVLNLDMNGKMFTANTNDILFRVNGTLNIYGNGFFQGSTYVASVNENGIINVYDGSFNNEVTSFQANGGVINIENGSFETYGETYGAKYTLNHVDAKKEVGLISVKGGRFVNYNPEKSESENPVMNFLAEGYGVTISYTLDNKPVYNIIPIIDIETPESLTNIISNLVNGESTYVKLVNDIELDGTLPMFINKGTSVILDLNNKTFTNKVAGRAAIINDGEIIIKNGFIVNGNNTKQGGAAILNRFNMTIENGTFGSSEQRGAAVENKGNLIINGGTFSSLEKGKDNSNGWAYVFINRGEGTPLMTINNANVNGNVHGVFCAESGVINVNGGMYTMGDENLSTYYMCYVIDGTINLNGGTFNWNKGLTVNTPIYKDGNGEINVNEGANINW